MDAAHPRLILDRVSFAASGRVLLEPVDLRVASGERLVVLGPNGAGKSLLLRIGHGLLVPTAGRVLWSDAAGAGPRQAMVFQRPVLLRRSVAANIEYALAASGFPRRRRKTEVQRVLAATGLGEHAAQPARTLSGGEQQRLALARAWVLQPALLFLDEPTAHLDPAATRAVEAIVTAIHADGATVVMTTHDLGQARRHADQIAFLHRGRLLEHTPAHQFFERPQSAEARAFLAGELLW
ncbi:MAG: ATP-binding cassette domain-containing protein [Gammaproteobacteria bacterium]